jgi:hypothetical protein
VTKPAASAGAGLLDSQSWRYCLPTQWLSNTRTTTSDSIKQTGWLKATLSKLTPASAEWDQYDDGDPGTPPSSHYQFQVDGKSYDGWIEDELSKGEPILIRYNSSDPSFNHAQDDHTTFVHKERHSLFLLFIVLAALGWFIRNRNPLEGHELEIDIGDGSFDSLRKAMMQRVGRDLTPKEELKLRRLADRIQKAAEEERIAIRKLADAINSQLGSSGT